MADIIEKILIIFVVILDADGQNPPHEIMNLVNEFNENEGRYEIIAGYRKNRKDHKYTLNSLFFLANSENIKHFETLFDYRFNYCIFDIYASREHIEKMAFDKIKWIF